MFVHRRRPPGGPGARRRFAISPCVAYAPEPPADPEVTQAFVELTHSASPEAWRALEEYIYCDYPIFPPAAIDDILANCFAALAPSDGPHNRVVLQVIHYVIQNCADILALFCKLDLPLLIHDCLRQSTDPTIVAGMLRVLTQFCEEVLPGLFSVPWGLGLALDIIRLAGSDLGIWRNIRCSLCSALAHLLPLCEMNNDQALILYGRLVPVIGKMDALPLVDWLHALLILLQKCPFLYDHLKVNAAMKDLVDFLSREDPRIVNFTSKILRPIARQLLDVLVPLNIPSVLVHQKGDGKCNLLALLKLINELTAVSADVSRQCIDVQLFSFASIHDLGFRVRMTWMSVLTNVVNWKMLPRDEPSKKAIVWVIEGCMESDEESAILTALGLVMALVPCGYLFDLGHRIEDLLEQAEMPKVAECARAFLETLAAIAV